MHKAAVILLITVLFSHNSYGQTADSTLSSRNKKYTLVRYPPFRDSLSGQPVFRNQQAAFGRKFLRAEGLVAGFQAGTIALLFALPEGASNWERGNIRSFGSNMKRAYTKAPVFDNDNWYVNYLGHPYQGAYYYNSMRSQGAKAWQSGLFCLGQSMLWEYTMEAGIEQPSIQDLIVTPIAGSLLGELLHFSACRMSNHGFRWYEKAFVSIFNPMYALNNGFKFAAPLKEF